MNSALLYGLVGAGLLVLGLHAIVRYPHLLRKVLALNIMSSGVFLLITALAERLPDGRADPVPHALVITGIVVAVASTGLALVLMLRVVVTSGRAELPPPRRD